MSSFSYGYPRTSLVSDGLSVDSLDKEGVSHTTCKSVTYDNLITTSYHLDEGAFSVAGHPHNGNNNFRPICVVQRRSENNGL
jgi:hypothetical protein